MVALDQQDAYFFIPVLQTHRHYLRFMVGHKHYQIAVLPYDLTSAPQVFMKVMAVVAIHLNRPGVPYIDDWQLKGACPRQASPTSNYSEPPAILGVHYQCAEVTPDTFINAPLHLSHSGYSAVSHLPPEWETPEHLGYYPSVSTSVLDFSENDC